MNAPALPLRDRLRAIDAARAERQTRLIAAFNRRMVDGLVTTARLASDDDRRAATAWIEFRAADHPVGIAPLLVDDALARMSDAQGKPDAVLAAAMLARIEPLVAALELVLGHELHPAGLQGGPSQGALLLRLDAGTPEGSILHRLLAALPDDLPIEPLSLPDMAPGAMDGLRLRWRASIAGPNIAAAQWNRLGRGDLLLLGTGPLTARFSLPGCNNRPHARVNVHQGVLILTQDLAADQNPVTVPDPEEAPAQPVASTGDLRVATTVEITGSTLAASELATLGQGSVLPLPVQGGTLAVRVLAGGEVVARGELVAVGQGFGVLVTALPDGMNDYGAND